MANKTVTKTPDFVSINYGSWQSASYSSYYFLSNGAIGFRQYLDAARTPVTACTLKETFYTSQAESGSVIMRCTAVGRINDNSVWSVSQDFSWDVRSTVTHTFSFPDLPGSEINNITFYTTTADGTAFLGDYHAITAPTLSYTYDQPTLGLTVQPSNAYVGDWITGSIENTFGQSFDVRFLYNSTLLERLSTSSASFSTSASESWFTTAGVTGSSMSVTVSITDGIGRTASARVTVLKHTALVPSITAPRGGSYNGGNTITFSWTASGEGSQIYAVLQYSTDGGSYWQSLANVGTAQSWTANVGTFPAGSIQWRIQLQNSYGIMSDWVSASFTVVYNGASVTLTTPTSGSRDGAEAITFGWTITPGSGNVTGTRFEISTDDGLNWKQLMFESKAVTSYTSKVAQFPAGKLLWRVSARDSYSGYGEWKQASVNITYSAVSQTVAVNSPTSGIINTASNKTFTVALQASAPVYAPFTVASATFFWRSGETGAFTEVAMTPGGNTASVTIPGGTIPSGRMEWYASATDNTGRTTETPHYVLTAMQADVEAAPISPWNTIESGSGPIPFRWAFGSLDGSPQGRAQLQYSTNGTAWLDENIFADLSGDGTSYTAPAGTFPGGTVYWRVRAYNEAGTAGAWSDAASFTVYAAPQVLGVTGDGKPFLTVTWQTTGQEAFELEINGKTYGPYFGADVRSYTLPEPLADGTYTARVRAQNRYGLWSEWTSGEVSVTNVPGPSILLFADDGVNALVRNFASTLAPTIIKQPQDAQGTSGTVTISIGFYPTSSPPEYAPTPSRRWYYRDPGGEWTEITGSSGSGYRLNITCAQNIDGRQYRCRLYNAVGEVYSRVATYHYAAPNMLLGTPITGKFRQGTGYFLVYRDDKLIGKTYEYDFTDRTTLGEHTYKFLQVLPGGYYSEDTVKATSAVDCPMIAPLAGGDFLELRLSENADREIQVTEAQEVVFTQYAGAEYPSAEIGEARSKSVSLDVSALMSDSDFAAAFKALLGKDVIVKTPGGEVVVGPLPGYNKRDRSSHRAWTFSVTQSDWRDFVDDT